MLYGDAERAAKLKCYQLRAAVVMSIRSVGRSLQHGENQGQELGESQGKRQQNQDERRPDAPRFQPDKSFWFCELLNSYQTSLSTYASASGLMEGDVSLMASGILGSYCTVVSPPLVAKENWYLNSKADSGIQNYPRQHPSPGEALVM